MKAKKYYLPYAPTVGDIIYKKGEDCGWVMDISKPGMAEDKAGVITSIHGPCLKSPMIQYDMSVLLLNGETVKTLSQEWGCFRQLSAMAKNYAAVQNELLVRLEGLVAKKELGAEVEEDASPDVT